MSTYTLNESNLITDEQRYRKFSINRISFIAVSGLILAASIIIYFNQTIPRETLLSLYGTFAFPLVTFTPYLLSAVVAAITTICVINLIPLLKSRRNAYLIAERIRQIGEGDLVTRLKIDDVGGIMKEISRELSISIGQLNHSVAKIKIINRQQWNYLQSIKEASLKEDYEVVSQMITKMESNWEMTAEIEELFRT